MIRVRPCRAVPGAPGRSCSCQSPSGGHINGGWGKDNGLGAVAPNCQNQDLQDYGIRRTADPGRAAGSGSGLALPRSSGERGRVPAKQRYTCHYEDCIPMQKQEQLASVDRAARFYEEANWLRALVQVVPCVGGTLDTLFAWRWNHIQRQRYEVFLKSVYRRMECIDASKLDRVFLDSDEFASLFFDVSTRVAREYEIEKIQLFRNVLVNSAMTEFVGDPLRDFMVGLLGELTLAEVHILQISDEIVQELRGPDSFGYVEAADIVEKLPTLQLEQARALCRHLFSLGFFYDWSIGRWDSGGDQQRYGTTEVTSRFLRFILHDG